jgi:hypothetical protein
MKGWNFRKVTTAAALGVLAVHGEQPPDVPSSAPAVDSHVLRVAGSAGSAPIAFSASCTVTAWRFRT